MERKDGHPTPIVEILVEGCAKASVLNRDLRSDGLQLEAFFFYYYYLRDDRYKSQVHDSDL